MKVIGVVTLVIFLLVQQSSRTAAQASYRTYGPIVSCGTFTSSPEATRRVYEWWALGFVSGVNMVLSAEDRPLIETDTEGIRAAFAKHCADHPLNKLSGAAESVVSELVAELQNRK